MNTRSIGWSIFPILLLNIFARGIAGCSTFCACKWKNGKQTVECTNKALSEVPDGLDPETQVLEFSGNNLSSIGKELFMKKKMINLQRIYLSRCSIAAIHEDTFKGLTNLVELDLSHNLIESLPSNVFASCPALMKLTLSFNRIRRLQKFSFNHLVYLNTLELANCEISEVEEDAFHGLNSLEWLYLSGNRIKTIRGRHTLPAHLKGVELQKNTWECDCHIQDLYAWLQDFTIPSSMEPVCHGPPRLARRAIKSIPAAELACLPDIFPTSLYLELGEGKNVSLKCHVHAVPEATVSWRFQGQMLQNNTMVAPGVHLIYFVEEGSENKRSELFIFNTNVEDNGTFICTAENAAGSVQSNFTIRIVLKEEPVVIIVSFPFEYFIAAVGIISFLGLLLITVCLVLICRCHKKRRRRQKEQRTKENLQYQQNANKCSILRDNNIDIPPDPVKLAVAGEETATNCDQDTITHYTSLAGAHPCESTMPLQAGAANQVNRSPSIFRRYQAEQNPDLINGTESVACRREGDGEDEPVHGSLETQLNPLPISCLRGSTAAEFYQDVQCMVDPEGYPIDYGLPKMPCQTQRQDNYYRTLPTNRLKRHSAANPINRYSREAEFLSRSIDSQYDHYRADVRYTADGYPARNPSENAAAVASSNASASFTQPENYIFESMPSSLPCCSVQWPTCVPANLHIINKDLEYNAGSLPDGQSNLGGSCVSKRCVSAQTDRESCSLSAANKIDTNVVNTQNDIVNEILTESPDEGYEGEPSVVV